MCLGCSVNKTKEFSMVQPGNRQHNTSLCTLEDIAEFWGGIEESHFNQLMRPSWRAADLGAGSGNAGECEGWEERNEVLGSRLLLALSSLARWPWTDYFLSSQLWFLISRDGYQSIIPFYFSFSLVLDHLMFIKQNKYSGT